MIWFFYALTATFGWGLADIFYKKSSVPEDKYSHLKISVWVGLVMGAASLVTLIVTGEKLNLSLFLRYSPASVSYISSMVVGYAGLRYLELSVISPVQNASGAFSTGAMVLYLLIFEGKTDFSDAISALDAVGTVIIFLGLIFLAIAEKSEHIPSPGEKKYTVGAGALIFPLTYCILDTLGTAADGIILSDSTDFNISETGVLAVYGLTFFFFGLGCFLFMLIKTKKPYNPFGKSEMPKFFAALCEEFGQIFYVFAMAAKPLLAAPVIGSYCIVSVLLSRLWLGEKLSKKQYACIVAVISGIVLLGISEGINS